MSDEAVDNEVADATVNVEPKEKEEAQDAAITNRAQSADDEHGDGEQASEISSEGQSAGETTDSAMPQAAGEEAGSEGSSTPTGSSDAGGAVAAVPAAPPSPEPASSESAIPEVSAHSSAVGEDEKTAPLGESDNDDDEDNNANNKNKKSIKKKSSSRYEPPPPFVDDPSKVTLRFIFPNKDGLNVTVDCKPTDTVGEVKGMLLSMWPDELAPCSGGNRLRLICMGKGILMPDTRSIQDCSVPVFKTHATPINVAVTPEHIVPGGASAAGKVAKRSRAGGAGTSGSGGSGSRNGTTTTASTGCGCVIQ